MQIVKGSLHFSIMRMDFVLFLTKGEYDIK